jgi:cyclic pyranopterin monophosphate synthase
MKIYAFEEIDEWLDAIPLAARRALDTCGAKLTAVAWRRMRSGARVAITSLGSDKKVDAARVRDLLVEEDVPYEAVTAVIDPPAGGLSTDLVRALGEARPLDAARWRTLAPLDRYALVRLARRGRSDRLRRAYDEIVADHAARPISTHLDAKGEVHMVDVGNKDVTARVAIARAEVRMMPETLARLRAGATPKGDVLATARVAAIQAAKRTSDLIPLCHAIALTRVDVDIRTDERTLTVDVRVEARDRTGVEMEAMVGASTGALTIYDMLKGMDRGMTFGVSLLEKSGGKSGVWTRS